MIGGGIGGTISAGLHVVPGNIEYRSSGDWGATWSAPELLDDGLVTSNSFGYGPVTGLGKTGDVTRRAAQGC